VREQMQKEKSTGKNRISPPQSSHFGIPPEQSLRSLSLRLRFRQSFVIDLKSLFIVGGPR
jgi:hypothetical protein